MGETMAYRPRVEAAADLPVIWQVAGLPVQLQQVSLERVSDLEGWIAAAPEMLFLDWMIIGRQEPTGWGAIADLVAIESSGGVVLIHLEKRSATREAAAAALEGASWLAGLGEAQLRAMYTRYSGRDLRADAGAKFGARVRDWPNERQLRIVIVGSNFEGATLRIMRHLASYGILIEGRRFGLFSNQGRQFLICVPVMFRPRRAKRTAAARTMMSTRQAWRRRR